MLTSGVAPGKLPPMTDVTSDAAATRLRRSPLHERHLAAGAKFAPFGGWEMPLEYAGGGVLKEDTALRLRVKETNGDPHARLFEVRGYA